MGYLFAKKPWLFIFICSIVLSGCKWVGDMIENQSQTTITLIVTGSSGEVTNPTLERERLFALPRIKKPGDPWNSYKVEAFDGSNRKIGTIDVNPEIRRRMKQKYVRIRVFDDRLEILHK
jgi:hypothetical protein